MIIIINEEGEKEPGILDFYFGNPEFVVKGTRRKAPE